LLWAWGLCERHWQPGMLVLERCSGERRASELRAVSSSGQACTRGGGLGAPRPRCAAAAPSLSAGAGCSARPPSCAVSAQACPSRGTPQAPPPARGARRTLTASALRCVSNARSAGYTVTLSPYMFVQYLARRARLGRESRHVGGDTRRFSCAAVPGNNTPADQAAHLHQQQQPGGARRQAGQGQAAVRLHGNLHVPAGAYRCSPAPGARSQSKEVAVHTRWSASRRIQQDSSAHTSCMHAASDQLPNARQ